MRKLYRKFTALISNFSPTLTSKIYYYTKLKKKLDLKNPKTFNEKLMYLKLNEYETNELVVKCADKYRVREYVKEMGCEEILNELIAVYDRVQDIDFDKLPGSFVLKFNNSAGYNVICKDKNELNIKETVKKMKKWEKAPYWKYVAELQYKRIEQKIICEKFMDSGSEDSLDDYKFFCFNGKPEFCMVCVGRNHGKPKYYFMDKNWNLMRINPDGLKAPDDFFLEKPKCIDEMYKYAEKLSKPFKFVRADFYDYLGKTVFGELTFTPAGCIDGNYTDDYQIEMGNKIKL